jgi:DNA-damage-inducible protein J
MQTLLIRIDRSASEGDIDNQLNTIDPEYDAWFREQVQEALDDPHPGIPSEEVEAHFAKRRAASLNVLRAKLLD